MRSEVHSRPRAIKFIALLSPFLASCESTPPAAPGAGAPPRAEASVLALGSSDALADAVLFVGNLVPGVPAGNGIYRFDGSGRLIDHMAQGGCCNTPGPDDHIYANRQQAFTGTTA